MHSRIVMRALLASALVVLAVTGCVPGSADALPTPTIVLLPAEAKASVATAQAERMLSPVAAESTPPVTESETTTPAGPQTATTTPATIEATPAPSATMQIGPTDTPPAGGTTPIALPTEHTVLPGQNLTSIGRLYGVTVQEFVQANGIANPSAIYIGQVLIIPAPQAASATGSPQAGTAIPATAPVAATPTPVPVAAMGRIAFQVASGGDIWAVNEDGSELVRLTQGLDPAWSPDGSRLAFVRWAEPRGLYVLDARTGEEQLVRGQNLIKSPTWNPTGDRLAYAWESSGAAPSRLCFPGFGCVDLPGQATWSLTVVDLEGNIIADLPADERSFSPSWSPQGDLIAYQGERALKGTYLSEERPWVIVDDVAAAFPEVSPDGSRIVFMYRQHDHWEVYSAAIDGSGMRRLTQSSPLEDTPANNVAPTWSPDGSQVLFLSDRDGQWRPYIMSADGTGQQPFLPGVFDQFAIQYDFSAERVFSWR